MAIAATSVWEIRATATANNVNGGFFVPGSSGVDYSQQNAAQYALTGVTSAGAGNVILTASAAADMVGNGIHTVSGTNFTNSDWFQIVSVVVGVSITCSTNKAGTSISTGVGASGVMNVGGAISLNSTLDEEMFRAGVPGNRWWIKAGTYTLGESVSMGYTGTTTLGLFIEGYNVTRGDTPRGTNRPLIAFGANSLTMQQYWRVSNLSITGTALAIYTPGSAMTINVKIVNSSTTTTRVAFNLTSSTIDWCEAVSARGYAVVVATTASCSIRYSYIHDSDVGIRITNALNVPIIIGCVIADNITFAIVYTLAVSTYNSLITACTLYGAENKLGTGISIFAGTAEVMCDSCIFYGFVLAASHGDATNLVYSDFNDFNNNTTDRTNWPVGANDSVLAPGFANVAQLTGSTATISGLVLTEAAANFASVTDNTDYVYIKSGSGATTGKYLITAHTTNTITLDNTPGTNAVADKVWQITTGHNFQLGPNLKALGSPPEFGNLTTNRVNMGAVQSSVSGGGNFAFVG